MNYLRFTLRFNSVYIIVAFTIQKLYNTYRPFSTSFKTKNSAWNTIKLLLFISFILNTWTLLFFKIESNEYQKKICDIAYQFKKIYYKVNITNIIIVMFLPMITVLISNILIFVKLKRDQNKKNLRIISTNNAHTLESFNLVNMYKCSLSNLPKLNQDSNKKASLSYLTFAQIINEKKIRKNKSLFKPTTKMLMLISFFFLLFTAPYVFAWYVYFHEMLFRRLEYEMNISYFFVSLQITEILFTFNYGLSVLVFTVSGSKLKQSSSKIF